MASRALSIALLALASLIAAAALAATLTGSGRSASEDRAVSGYSGLALSIPARVEIVQGTTEGLRITADDNLLAHIESVVERGILELRWRERPSSIRDARIRVIVNAKTLESLAIAGSGDATVWARDALRVNVAGSGDIRYFGDPTVQRNVVGSGSVRRVGAAPG